MVNQNGSLSFSICIPNYNYENYLQETINSVLNQSYQNFEIVVADNASTDNSVKAVKSFKSDKISLIENQYNIGFAPNLDRATQRAKNRFMILLSSDDIMHENALEEYAAVLHEQEERADQTILTSAVDIIDSDSSIVGSCYRAAGDLSYTRCIDKENENLPAPSSNIEKTRGTEALAHSLKSKESAAVFLATCYPRALYQQVEGYNSGYRIWPDNHFLHKLLSKDSQLIYVPKNLFGYREHTFNQLTVEKKNTTVKYQIDSYLHTLEFPKEVLEDLGMERDELIDVFLEKACLERGLVSVVNDNKMAALKYLAFGFATYPQLMLKLYRYHQKRKGKR